jgi:AcrR family transcriptional regulator
MARQPLHTREDFIQAAMAIVDSEGLDALSFRRLGDALGVSHTAAHNYFANKTELLDALVGQMMDEWVDDPPPAGSSPRATLVWLGAKVRTVFKRHPRMAPALLATTGSAPGSTHATMLVISLLRGTGLEGADLVRAYQMLEGYIVGWCVFEVGDSADHVAVRRARYRELGIAEFTAATASVKMTEASNEGAFLTGLGHILDGLGID